MQAIVVLDIFNTSRGTIAVLDFPEGKIPRIGMRLKQLDGATWKIAGIDMPQPSDLTNAYKHLEPPRLLFSCWVEPENSDKKLTKDDTLYVE